MLGESEAQVISTWSSPNNPNNCSVCFQAGGISSFFPGKEYLVVYPAPAWYNNPNNSSGYPEDQGDPEPKYDMYLGSPLPARHNPNNFSGSRPRRWAFPCWTAKKTGLAGGSPPPPSVPATLLALDYSSL